MMCLRRMLPLIDAVGAAAIVAAVCASLHPVFALAGERDKQTACISNLKRIGLAVALYADDYDDVIYPQVYNEYWSMPAGAVPSASTSFPDPKLWATAYLPYTRTADVFRCPYDGNLLRSTDQGDLSYRFGPGVPPNTPESAKRVSYVYVGLDIWAGGASNMSGAGAFKFVRRLHAPVNASPYGPTGWLARDKDFTITVGGVPRLATAHSVSPNPLIGTAWKAGVVSNVLWPNGSVKTMKDWDG